MSASNKLLFLAMTQTAFHGFFRLGELAYTNAQAAQNIVHLANIQLETSATGLRIVIDISHFKHSSGRARIYINTRERRCPVQCLLAYLRARGDAPGPLFMVNHKPVHRSMYDSIFQRTIRRLGLDAGRYKPHSLRIGATTQAALDGHSALQIRAMGRWKSDAFLKYIRLQ